MGYLCFVITLLLHFLFFYLVILATNFSFYQTYLKCDNIEVCYVLAMKWILCDLEVYHFTSNFNSFIALCADELVLG